MKYSLNKQEIVVKLNQETISEDKTDFHHRDFIDYSLTWYKRGYCRLQLPEVFLKNIRNKTFEYINYCVNDAISRDLPLLQFYHKQVLSGEEHIKVLKCIGKVIKPDILGIDVNYLAQKIKNACRTKVELDCLNVCDIRIFRPFKGNTMDNNPLHRDTWLPMLNNCINAYIPVAGNTRLSSLSLIPGSHLWDRGEVKRTISNAYFNGVQYGLPSVSDINRKFKVIRPHISDTEVLLFSSNIIHGGAVNLSKDITRISIEIRFWPKSLIPRLEID